MDIWLDWEDVLGKHQTLERVWHLVPPDGVVPFVQNDATFHGWQQGRISDHKGNASSTDA
jgi:hypothetical protein